MSLNFGENDMGLWPMGVRPMLFLSTPNARLASENGISIMHGLCADQPPWTEGTNLST